MTEELVKWSMPILVFLVAGVSYSLLGWWHKIKTYLRGDHTTKIDYRKMGKAAVLGLILGGAAYFAESSVTGNGVGDLTSPHEFAQQVIMTQGAIFAIDKLVLSGRGGTSKSNEQILADLNHNAKQDLVFDAELETPDVDSLPPGKKGA